MVLDDPPGNLYSVGFVPVISSIQLTHLKKSSKIKCDYCGSVYKSSKTECPNCGANNDSL